MATFCCCDNGAISVSTAVDKVRFRICLACCEARWVKDEEGEESFNCGGEDEDKLHFDWDGNEDDDCDGDEDVMMERAYGRLVDW